MDGLRVERDAKGGSIEIAWFNASFALILATFLVCKSIYQPCCLKLRSGLSPIAVCMYRVLRRGRLRYGRLSFSSRSAVLVSSLNNERLMVNP